MTEFFVESLSVVEADPVECLQAGLLSRVTGKSAKGKPVAHFLNGVPTGAIPLIAKLQPYAGCTWTRDLRELSNPDKHRHLAPLRSNVLAKVKNSKIVALDPETGIGPVEIQCDAEVEVFFRE